MTSRDQAFLKGYSVAKQAAPAKTEDVGMPQALFDALVNAKAHLDYCGYGDSWERECARSNNLPGQIDAAVERARAAGFKETDRK